MNKYIIIILSALCLCACYETTCSTISRLTVFTIKNDSNHNVSIKTDSKFVSYLEINIPNGDNYVTKKTAEFIHNVMDFVGNRCIVIFDDDIEVIHSRKIGDKTIEHNLCDESSYILNKSQKGTKLEYTYTFTDEDYDRAVAANKESEE